MLLRALPSMFLVFRVGIMAIHAALPRTAPSMTPPINDMERIFLTSQNAPARSRPAPDLRLQELTADLEQARADLALAYRQFDMADDPELVESCIYQISAVKARCNYLIRAIKERSPEAAAAAGLEGASTWT